MKRITDTERANDTERLKEWVKEVYDNGPMMFRWDKWLTPDEFLNVMLYACPDYNEFDVNRVYGTIINGLWEGVEIQIAREYSVCLYLRGPADTLKAILKRKNTQLRADEVGIQDDGTLRLWWD